ncbi:cell division cycle protein-like/CDC48 protein [Medicago truncatula]|uniref:Cell division cycle protein-like/CDC48 protein n=1 Tax=Medicago truncatula TaxID=3880 RepID=A0A072U2C5_MEDTR|nr:cell division cycle protein-like/CDC48 protein [Medicago truncatula]
MCGETESCTSSTNGHHKAEDVVGGNAKAIQILRELITYPRLFTSEAKQLGLKVLFFQTLLLLLIHFGFLTFYFWFCFQFPRGLLLYGPPGTGKTSLVRAIVEECGANLTIISPNTVNSALAGESERNLREAFSEASSHAALGKSSVIFIDEIDGLCPRRDSIRELDVRIASQLCTLMDSNKATSSNPGVVVVASTNRVDAIDPALRRYGRFDIETEVTVPNEEERLQILELYTRKIPRDSQDLEYVAASCNGYVGADLRDLCLEAVKSAIERSDNANKDVNDSSLTMEDWKNARSLVQPSITRGITVEIPKVTWKDIGGLKDVKTKLEQAIEWPMKHPDAFSRLGITPIRGILLHGPPGCSKTTLAKAAANAANVPFFSLRGDSSSGGAVVGERLLSTLLTEMDGLEEAKGVLVLAATNRPYAIDAALMRPGRFDLILYVPPPDLEGRFEILKVHTRGMNLGSDVDLRKLAEDTELFTGAELQGLCKEVGIVALRENIDASVVYDHHFKTAKNSLKPALTAEEIVSYSSFKRTSSRALSKEIE